MTTISICALGADESSNNLPDSLPDSFTPTPVNGFAAVRENPGYAAHPQGGRAMPRKRQRNATQSFSAHRGPDASKLVPSFNYFAARYLLAVVGFLSGQ